MHLCTSAFHMTQDRPKPPRCFLQTSHSQDLKVTLWWCKSHSSTITGFSLQKVPFPVGSYKTTATFKGPKGKSRDCLRGPVLLGLFPLAGRRISYTWGKRGVLPSLSGRRCLNRSYREAKGNPPFRRRTQPPGFVSRVHVHAPSSYLVLIVSRGVNIHSACETRIQACLGPRSCSTCK